MDGLEVLKSLRKAKIETPIVILSGSAGIDSKVKTFSVGADDYITKPFHKDELVARLHAVARRARGHAQSVIVTGALAVNIDARTVELGGQPPARHRPASSRSWSCCRCARAPPSPSRCS